MLTVINFSFQFFFHSLTVLQEKNDCNNIWLSCSRPEHVRFLRPTDVSLETTKKKNKTEKKLNGQKIACGCKVKTFAPMPEWTFFTDSNLTASLGPYSFCPVLFTGDWCDMQKQDQAVK